MRDPLSEIARKALSVTEARCLKQGLDLPEELNRLGLLATEPRIREIQVSALENLVNRMQSMGAAGFNPNPGTPADMYNSVVGWIHTYIYQVAHD
jgi:hypothetical protein